MKVTWERDSSNIHQPQANDTDEIAGFINEMNFLDSTNEQRYPHGHVVHARCWMLIERMIGSEVENNLELLLEICRERFHENPYDIHEYQGLDMDTNTYEPTSQPTLRWWNPLGPVSPLDPSRHHRDVQKDPRQSIPLRDPLDIPDIHKLIHHSAQNKVREITKRKTRRWSSMIMTCFSSSSSKEHARSIRYYQVIELPPELVMWVLDNLSHHTDIRNALIAFNWKVPDVYWKARVSNDLIFELQDEKERLEDLDWKFLSLGILELMEQPNLRNRKRVLGLVDEIRRRFWERVAEPEKSIIQGRLN